MKNFDITSILKINSIKSKKVAINISIYTLNLLSLYAIVLYKMILVWYKYITSPVINSAKIIRNAKNDNELWNPKISDIITNKILLKKVKIINRNGYNKLFLNPIFIIFKNKIKIKI